MILSGSLQGAPFFLLAVTSAVLGGSAGEMERLLVAESERRR